MVISKVVWLVALTALTARASIFDRCSGHGITSADDYWVCTCMSGYYGPDCSQRSCPHGRSWVNFPTATDESHHLGVECSDVGYCNRDTGACACRDLFDGPACERLVCPLSDSGATCSGHGQCVTQSWAADHWNGLTLVRPNVTYALWDADKVTGCLCDKGYSGFNCSKVDCPRGDYHQTQGQQNELVRIRCRADAGSLALFFRGDRTIAIPHDTPYAHLERYIENLDMVGDVEVYILNSSQLCDADYEVETTIEFLQDFGDLPAMRAEDVDLTLGGGPATLDMLTRQWLLCPSGACDASSSACTGGFYLQYDGQLTSKLAWNSTTSEVESALEALATLGPASDFGAVNVTVNGTTVCAGPLDAAGARNMSIEFRAQYGNVYNLSMVNSLRSDTGALVNLTLRADKGTKENEFCSNRGTCDFSTGTCMCRQLDTGPWGYSHRSSDGYGNAGTRGDCGHSYLTPRSCPAVWDEPDLRWYECDGHGRCDNATFSCVCADGRYGGDCSLRTCPNGPSWFGEATGPNEAHASAECSNMGECERNSGECHCRSGFGGVACERMMCATDSDSNYCSGHGVCLPYWRLAEVADYGGDLAGLTYGAATQEDEAQWDSRRVWGCRCDTKDGLQGDAGPVSHISGIEVANPSTGGYTGYDCSRRWCPTGDDIQTPGAFEVQTVYCSEDRESSGFTVSFRQQTSVNISSNATVEAVVAALRNMTTINEVSVEFVNGVSPCEPRWAHSQGDFGMRVTFLSELGDLPMLTTEPWYNVSETHKGTKENAECGNHGVCDYEKGLCQCLKGYVGSDGDGNVGDRRDCGRLDPYGSTLNEFEPADS